MAASRATCISELATRFVSAVRVRKSEVCGTPKTRGVQAGNNVGNIDGSQTILRAMPEGDNCPESRIDETETSIEEASEKVVSSSLGTRREVELEREAAGVANFLYSDIPEEIHFL